MRPCDTLWNSNLKIVNIPCRRGDAALLNALYFRSATLSLLIRVHTFITTCLTIYILD